MRWRLAQLIHLRHGKSRTVPAVLGQRLAMHTAGAKPLDRLSDFPKLRNFQASQCFYRKLTKWRQKMEKIMGACLPSCAILWRGKSGTFSAILCRQVAMRTRFFSGGTTPQSPLKFPKIRNFQVSQSSS